MSMLENTYLDLGQVHHQIKCYDDEVVLEGYKSRYYSILSDLSPGFSVLPYRTRIGWFEIEIDFIDGLYNFKMWNHYKKTSNNKRLLTLM